MAARKKVGTKPQRKGRGFSATRAITNALGVPAGVEYEFECLRDWSEVSPYQIWFYAPTQTVLRVKSVDGEYEATALDGGEE